MGCDEDRKYVRHRHPHRLEEELCCFGLVEICELLPTHIPVLDKFVSEFFQTMLPTFLLRLQKVCDVCVVRVRDAKGDLSGFVILHSALLGHRFPYIFNLRRRLWERHQAS
jgi:hypothetical protein